ncbi:uncharacterized protein [Venturia canescens]|uniref:uncharacterized protein isoform X1 n=1 Tax=Venturia canescens TaxID=32260 RepID=UPI001C9CDB48|nr:uncharacterized protein LOC122418872 isoform X1 [Venturia canescens]
MPESEAVYQPTTEGYTYEAGGNTNDPGNGFRSGFSRILFRHKVSTRKWAEWVLLSVAICASVAGLTTLLVNLFAADANDITYADFKPGNSTRSTKVEGHMENGSRGSIAVGATITLIGLLLGCSWAWLRFFKRSKSPRGGMNRGSGQMLGGLNPSTDLLVGSTSQYGPVLTEVPSQMMPNTMTNNVHDVQTVALSDQEEETRTLMPDVSGGTSAVTLSSDPLNGDLRTGQITG